jgi:hypothetical protein
VSAGSFIASLVGSLAWPAVIVAILIIFHKQFGTMLERLARLRLGTGAGDGDPDWTHAEGAVRQALTSRTAADRPPDAAAPGSPPARPAVRTSQQLIEDRWQAVAGQLRGLIRPSGSLSEEQLGGTGFEQLMDIALRAGLLDAATVRSLDGLAHLRNLARTSAGLTARQAQEFAVLADAVSYGMQRDSGSVWPAR